MRAMKVPFSYLKSPSKGLDFRKFLPKLGEIQPKKIAQKLKKNHQNLEKTTTTSKKNLSRAPKMSKFCLSKRVDFRFLTHPSLRESYEGLLGWGVDRKTYRLTVILQSGEVKKLKEKKEKLKFGKNLKT